MGYLRNLLSFALFALIITGCGGGSSLSTNDSNNNTGGNTGGGGGNTGGGGGNTGGGGSGTLTLQWSAPTTLADNVTPVSPSAVTGYTLFYGPSSTNTPNAISINSGTTTQYSITLPSGTYFFRIGAIDNTGHLGLLSSPLQKTI